MAAFFRLFLISMIIFSLSDSVTLSFGSMAQFPPENEAINYLQKRDFLGKWVILGPFPNDISKDQLPDGSYHYGYYTDYLVSIGGENNAIIEDGKEIIYELRDGGQKSVIPKFVTADSTNILNLERIVGRLDNKAAYDFSYLHSEKNQEVTFLLGSDDAVKVWINGDLVHQNYVARGLKFGEDRFSVKLHEGLNPVLVKVVQGLREWAFVVEALNQEAYEEVKAEEQAWQDFNRFLNCTFFPKQANRWNYFFNPGEFPVLDWENKYLVEKVIGDIQLNVRWFDKNLNEVESAENPGRYGYYIEGKSNTGMRIRRAGTMYCIPWNWVAWGERMKAALDYVPIYKNKKIWENHRDKIADYTGRIALISILDQREGAVLMSYIDEMEAEDNPSDLTDTPIIKDHDFHLALKQKILGSDNKSSKLKMPAKISGAPAIILHNGSEQEAGFKAGTAEKIREICQEWYRESGEPFQTLVARNGVVIISEVFSDPVKDDYDNNTISEVASITKLLTGMMFAQFVDQGLIAIDDPVGKYLPDFPREGPKALTLRHCFTHTGGLWGHEEWGGMHNPWLDNVIANLLPRIEVGVKHEYNGMGYDLAGKIMEMVSNKSIFRLMRENFFDPLELNNTILEEDLAFGCHSKAEEFAVFGQLLLNKGSYADLKFFSEETFKKLLPQPLNKYYPGIDGEWGIGITWMRQKHPDAGKNGYPDDKTILSKNVIGHGSATSAILRVDLDNDLVICQTRRNGGQLYDQYLEKFLMAIEEGL